MKEFTQPQFEKNLVGYSFLWEDTGLRIELSRLNDEAKGEIGFYHENGTGRQLLKYGRINLLDNRAIDQLTKSLTKNNEELDWSRILTYVAGKTLQTLRDGEPIQNINCEPTTKAVSWTLKPLLPANEPTTIFGPGGKGKSLIADMVAVMVKFGVTLDGLPYLIPTLGNVLYLDWERSEEVHRQRISAIKNTLAITDNREIAYIKCDHHVGAIIDYLCQKVNDINANLVIIDSQMGATAGMGHGMSDAEVSGQYYNLIRRFNCTTLTIDHTTKMGMGDETATDTPFGSVVKYNRATSIYSVKTIQESESDTLSLALKHEKFNLGRKQATRGIAIEFENNDTDELTGISFGSFNLADHESFSKAIPEWQIIASILERGAKDCGSIAEIAKQKDPTTKIDTKRAYNVMTQKPKVFTKVGDTKLWGLLARGSTLL